MGAEACCANVQERTHTANKKATGSSGVRPRCLHALRVTLCVTHVGEGRIHLAGHMAEQTSRIVLSGKAYEFRSAAGRGTAAPGRKACRGGVVDCPLLDGPQHAYLKDVWVRERGHDGVLHSSPLGLYT